MHEANITDLPSHEFIAVCAGWKADMEKEGKWDDIQKDIDLHVLNCPLHRYASVRGMCKRTTGGTEKCPICGNYMCPGCNSHAVDIMSRVTGYLSMVSGWNAPKSQEFEDRKRHTLDVS